MDDVGYKVIVYGRVQGVGFRYSTFKQAHKLNLTGHAKNLDNGSVEVLIFGNQDKAKQLLTWLKTGPDIANVTETYVLKIIYDQTRDRFSME